MPDSSIPIRREDVLRLVRAFVDQSRPSEFIPGKTRVQFAGRVLDSSEYVSLVDAALDGWFTGGRFTESFEEGLAEFLGARSCVFVNSGSSANLLALSTLTSNSLGDRRLKAGDEIITAATGFPSTVAPILQNGLVPVFVDITLPTYNVSIDRIEDALTTKTRGLMLAHTLGNPFDLKAVMDIAARNDLFVIEDACDSLGSMYNGKSVGTFGELSTVSFYPAHHITTGEGGAVATNVPELERIVRSFRDWGRDCYCETGASDSCGMRFQQQFGNLPFGYDHKYVYTHLGYNMKATDLQASIGVAQLKKLPDFVQKRRLNFDRLYRGLEPWQDVLTLPRATVGSAPAWFAFPITVNPEAKFDRGELVRHLERSCIETRMLFGGNLTKQPAFIHAPHRIVGDLSNADTVMNRTFFVGVFPGLSTKMIDYVVESLDSFVRTHQ